MCIVPNDRISAQLQLSEIYQIQPVKYPQNLLHHRPQTFPYSIAFYRLLYVPRAFNRANKWLFSRQNPIFVDSAPGNSLGVSPPKPPPKPCLHPFDARSESRHGKGEEMELAPKHTVPVLAQPLEIV